MPFERDPNEIGSLWLKTGRKGEYMTGKIGDQDVILFPIQSANPKAPTWRVLKSTPREDRPQQAAPRYDSEPDTDIAF